MIRNVRNDTAPKRRAPGRKEWGRNVDAEHPMEAPKHARQPGPPHQAHGGRVAHAAQECRELRARF